MKKIFCRLMRRDHSGTVRKAGEKVAELYQWAGDFKKAKEMKEFTDKDREHRSKDKKKQASSRKTEA